MSMIDYGALLRVDGKFINKNCGLFMNASNTGYVCKRAINNDGKEYVIDGNYFVYAGDENFLIVFYKGIYQVISNEKILYTGWDMPFNSETYFFDELPNLKVSRLSKDFEIEKYESLGTWKDFVREHWIDATGDEKLYELQGGRKAYKRFMKAAKHRAREKGFKTRPYRFFAEWYYNRHHYEVIFGYGIEPNEEVWNKIKNKSYGFRKEEIKLIDSWFNGKEINPCYSCDCNDPDLGCTMPSLDKRYACPLEVDEEELKKMFEGDE